MENKGEYSYELTVDVHDVDFNGVCKTSSILKYIQSAAQSQLTENGMSYDNLKERGVAFIISRMNLEVYTPIRVYDKLRAISFPCHSHGFIFIRCYKLLRGEETVACAYSQWALIDINKHSLIRTEKFSLGIPTSAPLDMDTAPFRISTDLTEIGTYNVAYCDIDQNRHINNTKYADIFAGFLPMDGKWIKKISINYKSEATDKEQLVISIKAESSTYYIRTIKSDGSINAEAEIILDNLPMPK